MNAIRATLAISWKELQVTFRDRGLLAILFLLPLVFSTLFSLSQQGALDVATGATAMTVRVFVVNDDEGAYGRQVARDYLQDKLQRLAEIHGEVFPPKPKAPVAPAAARAAVADGTGGG